MVEVPATAAAGSAKQADRARGARPPVTRAGVGTPRVIPIP